MKAFSASREPHFARLLACVGRAGVAKATAPLQRGGEEGIRTLDTGSPYTPLAGERLRPLGHLSTAVDSEGRHPFQAELR